MTPPSQQTVRLATHAMATRFELILFGTNPVRLQAAGEAAIREINQIASRFSFYDAASELSAINNRAFHNELPLTGDLYELLERCDELVSRTSGYFDPTVGPLMRLWNLSAHPAALPSGAAIRAALEETGWKNVSLNPKNRSVRLLKPGIKLDLGGIAKGWALDEAAQLLRESGVDRALLHGGTSSVIAIGAPLDGDGWKIGIEDPYLHLLADSIRDSKTDAPVKEEAPVEKQAPVEMNTPVTTEAPAWFDTRTLKDSALSVSAVHGKSVEVDNVEYGHVINPISGGAVTGPFVSVVEADNATDADAFSTAVLAGYRPAPEAAPTRTLRASLFKKTDAGWEIKTEF